MNEADWVMGSRLSIAIPAHPAALLSGGEDLLTKLFHAFGSLPADNHIAAITHFEPFAGGGTGSKVQLSVRYAQPAPGLPNDLFVKFSRDFTDPIRDRARFHMDSEIRLAILSCASGFPIAVPKCLYADFDHESGTGILISERIPYGIEPIEQHYPKCLDERMPEPLEHYRALIATVARLAGMHKAGALPADVADQFPFDLAAALSANPLPASPESLDRKIERIRTFADNHPRLLAENIRSPAFLARFAREARTFYAHDLAIRRFLHGDADLIALCHWNANVDNAWFWRDDQGSIQCGLMDWGSVGQMSVAMTLWGCLSGAPTWIWDDHLDALLDLFIAEFHQCGGPLLDRAGLERHLQLYVAMQGLAWLIDAPMRIIAELPDLATIESPFDSRFTANETARVQRLMMSNFLNLWERSDMIGAFEHVLDGAATAILRP